ncbi:MAG: hypothetical protein LBV27_05060, partial [Oscillospiraceae bacterium]|nr:hypothetical protein [Oscillospiraceae bacterium]
MKYLSVQWVEIKRLMRGKTTWLLMGLAALSPIGGYLFYKPATDMTKTAIYIGNPALCGALAGAVLSALLTLFEMDRVHKYEMAKITNGIVSERRMNLCRLVAVFAASLAATLLSMAINLPYALYSTHSYFRFGDFL